MNNEVEWRIIPNHENYEVSEDARVRRVDTKKELKPYLGNDGRRRVDFYDKDKKNRKCKFLLHRLVAMLFIPNPDNKRFACHKDGNCWNNHAENLYWGSAMQNYLDSVEHGTANRMPISDEVVAQIREMRKARMTINDIARNLKVCRDTVIKYVGTKGTKPRRKQIINIS